MMREILFKMDVLLIIIKLKINKRLQYTRRNIPAWMIQKIE